MRIDHLEEYNKRVHEHLAHTDALITQMEQDLAMLKHHQRVAKRIADKEWKVSDTIVPDSEKLPSMFNKPIDDQGNP